jgi:hypothetical protein
MRIIDVSGYRHGSRLGRYSAMKIATLSVNRQTAFEAVTLRLRSAANTSVRQ